jgi:hypothetical protein
MSSGQQDYLRNLSKPSMIKALAAEPDLMPQARAALEQATCKVQMEPAPQ